MSKFIISCAAVLLAVSAYAEGQEEPNDVASDATVTVEDSSQKEYGCGKCGGGKK